MAPKWCQAPAAGGNDLGAGSIGGVAGRIELVHDAIVVAASGVATEAPSGGSVAAAGCVAPVAAAIVAADGGVAIRPNASGVAACDAALAPGAVVAVAVGGAVPVPRASGGAAGGIAMRLIVIVGAAGGIALVPSASGGAAGGLALVLVDIVGAAGGIALPRPSNLTPCVPTPCHTHYFLQLVRARECSTTNNIGCKIFVSSLAFLLSASSVATL